MGVEKFLKYLVGTKGYNDYSLLADTDAKGREWALAQAKANDWEYIYDYVTTNTGVQSRTGTSTQLGNVFMLSLIHISEPTRPY